MDWTCAGLRIGRFSSSTSSARRNPSARPAAAPAAITSGRLGQCGWSGRFGGSTSERRSARCSLAIRALLCAFSRLPTRQHLILLPKMCSPDSRAASPAREWPVPCLAGHGRIDARTQSHRGTPSAARSRIVRLDLLLDDRACCRAASLPARRRIARGPAPGATSGWESLYVPPRGQSRFGLRKRGRRTAAALREQLPVLGFPGW